MLLPLSIVMINGFHIELTNICTLKCSGCARTQFINMFPQHWKNHSIDVNSLMQFLDVDLNNKFLYICGHYGDSIYHPDFHNIISQLKSRGAILEIVTNGSYKTKNWWEQTVGILTEQDTVTFSVDGLPENFTTYRVNADWKSIKIGMQVVAQNKCKSKWSYIPFNYNENNIEQAKDLCKKLGIKEFEINYSDRWDKHTVHLRPSDDKIGSRDQAMQNWKNTSTTGILNPECNNGKNHFISADGYYTPCCYTRDFRFYYQTPFGLNKENYNINTTTITQILQSQETKDFVNNFKNFKVCQFNCGTCNA